MHFAFPPFGEKSRGVHVTTDKQILRESLTLTGTSGKPEGLTLSASLGPRTRITADSGPSVFQFTPSGVSYSDGEYICGLRAARKIIRTAQEVRAVVWQSEACRFDPTLGVSKCP